LPGKRSLPTRACEYPAATTEPRLLDCARPGNGLSRWGRPPGPSPHSTRRPPDASNPGAPRREWPLPEKPAPAHSHGSKGFEKGHKRDREAETRAVAWRAACEQADERIAQHRADQRAKRHSMLNWYDKLFLSPDQLKKRRKAIKATPTK